MNITKTKTLMYCSLRMIGHFLSCVDYMILNDSVERLWPVVCFCSIFL